ncbi:SMP-30/gluconolactonase/LRE family protein [Shewanella maritima]|uniref:SMP-30/gluconolactonase/LRE family protein n=1 Tax=Shewanella maritima TaxID=2520507 RepID=UPI0037369A76
MFHTNTHLTTTLDVKQYSSHTYKNVVSLCANLTLSELWPSLFASRKGLFTSSTRFAALLGVSLIISPQSIANELHCDASKLPLSTDAVPMLISDNFKFLEGPTWSANQQVFYFSEMDFNGPQLAGPEAKIYTWSEHSGINLFHHSSYSNGLLVDENTLYVMDHGNRALSQISINDKAKKQASITPLSTNFQQQAFNSPNDLVKHIDGTIYFTDPDWQLGKRVAQTPYTGVYRYHQGETTLLTSKLTKPNGIALSPDQNTLYVGHAGNQIFAYLLAKDGSIAAEEFIIDIDSPDGMAIDCAGNIYATSHSQGKLHVFNSQGQQLHEVGLGVNVTNVAFGGINRQTLLITTAKGLYKMKTQLPGLQ